MPSTTEYLNDARRPAVAGRAWWLPALAALFLLGHPAFAQEGLRSSLAGEQAAEQQKNAQANQYYNLEMGDLKLRFQSSLQVEANDNVNLSDNDRVADASIKPELDMTALWPVTENNTLAVNLGGGYEEYLKTKSLDNFFFNPNSSISFNIYAGDFLINLHTSFAYSEQQYQSVDVSSNGNFVYFDDLTGISVTWDLDKLKLILDYDHEIYESPTPGFSYLNRNSELVSFRAGVELLPETFVGLELGGSLDNYQNQPNYKTNGITNDVPVIYVGATNPPPTVSPTVENQPIGNFVGNQQSVNFGPYIQGALSKHLQVEASAGYTIYFTGQSSFNPYPGQIVSYTVDVTSNGPPYQVVTNRASASSTLTAIYADLTLTHILNDRVRYTLSTGHQIQNGLYSGTLDLYYLYLNPTFLFIRNVTLSTPLNFNYAERGGTAGENYIYVDAGIEASYQLNRKLSLNGGYHFRDKESDVSANDFVQNQLVLGLHYSF